MRVIIAIFSAYLTWLCQIWEVNPRNIDNGQRGNLPPPTGGIASV